MNIWPTAPVDIEPEILLSNWQVMELDSGSRHFVGRNVQEFSGRVSSAIVSFDPHSMTGKTRSGRIYRLQGGPGYDEDGQYVWSLWARIHYAAKSYADVTSEYWQAGSA